MSFGSVDYSHEEVLWSICGKGMGSFVDFGNWRDG